MDNGTLWLNLGDKYSDSANAKAAGVKPGELIGLPWRVAMSLQADGWYLRSDLIWAKPNPKPEGGLTNRPTRAHEYLFLLSRREDYYYDIDALREPVTSSGGACFGKQRHATAGTGVQNRRLDTAAKRNHPLGKNKRTVWSIPVCTVPGAHTAVFPPALVRPCILAGCPEGGTVLDPFAGSGTTAVVAEELGRNSVLIELNPAYLEMQKQRTAVRYLLGAGEQSNAFEDRRGEPTQAPATQPKVSRGGFLWDET